MPASERGEPTTGFRGPQLLRSALLLSVTCALLALTFGIAFLADSPQSFFADNAMSRGDRIRLCVAVLVGGTIGAATSVFAVLLRKERGAAAIELVSKRCSPLALLWAVFALATDHLWPGHSLTFLVFLGAIVLLLERSLWVSGLTFPRYLLDELSERYRRLPLRLQRLAPLAVVLASAIGYAAYTGYWSIEQHERLATRSSDLGIVDNLILFPGVKTLLVIQSLLLGFAAVPLYGFAQTKLPRWSAALVSVAYLSFAPLHGLNFYDFHLLPVCIFFLFCLFWALATDRPILVWVFWAICVSVREDVSVGFATLGIFLTVTGSRVRTGIWMIVLSTVTFVLIKFVVMKMAGTWWFANLYKDLMPEGERNYLGVVMTLLTNPSYVVSTLLTQDKLIYALHLLAPVAFLPLRRWVYLWLLFPGVFFTVMTTQYKPTISIAFQYISHWIPFVFAAVVLEIARMGRSPSGVVHRRATLAALVVGVTLHSLSFGAILRPTKIDEGSYGLLARVGDFYLFERGHESPETVEALKKVGLKPEVTE